MDVSIVLHSILGLHREIRFRGYCPGGLLLSCASGEGARWMAGRLHRRPLMAGTSPLKAVQGPEALNLYPRQKRSSGPWQAGTQEEFARRLGVLRATRPSQLFNLHRPAPHPRRPRESSPEPVYPRFYQPGLPGGPAQLTAMEQQQIDKAFRSWLEGTASGRPTLGEEELMWWETHEPAPGRSSQQAATGTGASPTPGSPQCSTPDAPGSEPTPEDLEPLARTGGRRSNICGWCQGQYPLQEAERHVQVCLNIYREGIQGGPTDLCPRCGGKFLWESCKAHAKICTFSPHEQALLGGLTGKQWRDLTRSRSCPTCGGRIPRCAYNSKHRPWCRAVTQRNRAEGLPDPTPAACLRCGGRYPPPHQAQHEEMCSQHHWEQARWIRRRALFSYGEPGREIRRQA